MKIRIFCISILILFLNLTLRGFCADESSWESLMDDYSSAQAQKIKPVSDKEFQDALQSVKDAKNGKKNKKKQKPIKNNQGPYKRETPNGGDFFYQGMGNLFLQLPYNLYYNEKVIPIGYYKVTPYFTASGSYLLLKQGRNEVYQLEMQNVKNVCPDKVSCFNSGVYQDNYFKLEYKDLDHSVANYFYILH